MPIEHAEYASMMRRMLGAWERRLSDADAYDVAELANYAGEVNEAIDRVVASMRAGGRTWAEIGEAFGTSRQAVQRRFSHLPGPSRYTRAQ